MKNHNYFIGLRVDFGNDRSLSATAGTENVCVHVATDYLRRSLDTIQKGSRHNLLPPTLKTHVSLSPHIYSHKPEGYFDILEFILLSIVPLQGNLRPCHLIF
jgi:hypothetical protein